MKEKIIRDDALRNLNIIKNPDFINAGLLHSVKLGLDEIKDKNLIIFSDILFNRSLIEDLLKRDDDIVLVVDNSFKSFNTRNKRLDLVILENPVELRSFETNLKNSVIKIGKSIDENTAQISGNSVELSDFMINNCGSGALNKRIPFSLIKGYEEEFYNILIDGDGCRYNGKEKFEAFSTISETLANDVCLLANSLGYRAGVSKANTPRKGIILGREVNLHTKYSVRIGKEYKYKYNDKGDARNMYEIAVQALAKVE